MMTKVSIITTVYNHEPFIRRALESVLMQQTDFEWELLVGDDASSDGSQAVIREMEPLFHGRMKPVLREANLGTYGNNRDLLERAQGEYLAFLEGDDYWTNPCKLQKQADFLDAHPDYSACYHKNQMVDVKGRVIAEKMPVFPVVGDYTLEDYDRFLLPGQTATLMFRGSLLDMDKADALPKIRYMPGDRLVPLMALAHGKIYCSDEVMSAYRTARGSDRKSWSTTYDRGDFFSERYFFRMSLEMEAIGQRCGLPVCMKEYRQERMTNALRALRGRKFQYFPLLCDMVVKDKDRRGFCEQVWKPYWQETKEIVRQKFNKKKRQ